MAATDNPENTENLTPEREEAVAALMSEAGCTREEAVGALALCDWNPFAALRDIREARRLLGEPPAETSEDGVAPVEPIAPPAPPALRVDREGFRPLRDKGLRAALASLADDPSLPEEAKIRSVIHLSALGCAVLAAEPMPVIDLALLAPMLIAMVWGLNRVMGKPVGRAGVKEIATTIAGVAGAGYVARYAVLSLTKIAMPVVGGALTVPAVYAATMGIGYAARAALEAYGREQRLSEDEIRRIRRSAETGARAGKRDWNLDSLRREMAEWTRKTSAYGAYRDSCKEYVDLIYELRRKRDGLVDLRTALEHEAEEADAARHRAGLAAPDRRLDAVDLPDGRLADVVRDLREADEELTRMRSRFAALLQERFRSYYPNVWMGSRDVEYLTGLPYAAIHAFEVQLARLHHSPLKAAFRGEVEETPLREVGFAVDGRAYVHLDGEQVRVCRVGNDASRARDLRYVREHYRTDSLG